MKRVIGFSTNDLYYEKMSLDEKVKFSFDVGANAIELGFNSVEDLLKYEVSEKTKEILLGFDFVSVHAPKISKEDSERVFERLRYLVKEIGIKGIVIHYDGIEDFGMFDSSGLPFAVENMNSDKVCGKTLNEFRELADKYKNLKFVLDLQHAYEHDNSMRLAGSFVEVMGDRLSHLHVSGRSGKVFHHIPVCVANNGKVILKGLKICGDVPIILEGLLDGDVEELARRELEEIKMTWD